MKYTEITDKGNALSLLHLLFTQPDSNSSSTKELDIFAFAKYMTFVGEEQRVKKMQSYQRSYHETPI